MFDLVGFYPAKGVIAPGSDPDLVVLDPAARRVIRADALAMGAGWTPYEGVDGRYLAARLG